MVREFSWRLKVRSYEADAWGLVPASGLLRYFEQSAINAAADAGYGREFHEERGSAWVVRRITMLMHAPATQYDELEITTWLSTFARVRGGREYRVRNAGTGQMLYTGITEWVYLDRRTLKPLAIPPHLAVDFDVPGAPLQSYDSPEIEQNLDIEHVSRRTAEWHEADSMRHVNNSVYANWLDEGVRAAMEGAGWSTAELAARGLHLRGERYNLDYKQAALPGDDLKITTLINGISGRLCALKQTIASAEGKEILTTASIYGWRDDSGEPAPPPEGWEVGLRE